MKFLKKVAYHFFYHYSAFLSDWIIVAYHFVGIKLLDIYATPFNNIFDMRDRILYHIPQL
jgi:hypothetical protein